MHSYLLRIYLGLALISGITVQSAFIEAAQYETYLESWDSSWSSALTGLPAIPAGSSTSYNNVMLNIAFASYTFPGLNGLQFADPNTDTNTVISFVHAQNGKVKLSYGGASYSGPNYFISQTKGWPSNISTLAAGVSQVINTYNFDGVDFDIEDPLPTGTTAQNFADQLMTFLTAVRKALPDKTISLTIPAQGWGTYWKILAQQAVAAPETVDYISFMEYDIWIGGSRSYVQQIQADLLTYTSPTDINPAPNGIPGWGIPVKLVQLGLMPGKDDTNQNLSVADAETLTQYAVTNGLFGVMTWDLNRDAATSYAYSNAIRGILDTNSLLEGKATLYPKQKHKKIPQLKKKARKRQPPFVRQSSPLHGAPR